MTALRMRWGYTRYLPVPERNGSVCAFGARYIKGYECPSTSEMLTPEA